MVFLLLVITRYMVVSGEGGFGICQLYFWLFFH